jgi:formate dehydrogenase beta subunit
MTGILDDHPPVKPTDTRNPDYYHKVVDCQWACPAHTNVPEYIRLIAQGRYTDATC